jgi:hypothetical protein
MTAFRTKVNLVMAQSSWGWALSWLNIKITRNEFNSLPPSPKLLTKMKPYLLIQRNYKKRLKTVEAHSKQLRRLRVMSSQ